MKTPIILKLPPERKLQVIIRIVTMASVDRGILYSEHFVSPSLTLMFFHPSAGVVLYTVGFFRVGI